jgi:hypothetical protein
VWMPLAAGAAAAAGILAYRLGTRVDPAPPPPVTASAPAPDPHLTARVYIESAETLVVEGRFALARELLAKAAEVIPPGSPVAAELTRARARLETRAAAASPASSSVSVEPLEGKPTGEPQ